MSRHGMRQDLLGRNGPRGARGLGETLLDIGIGLLPDVIEEIIGRDLSELPGLPTAGPNGANGNGGARFDVTACGAVQGRTQAAFINGQPCCPTGFHFSKTSGCCIKNRKMNVLNMRAHSRATRRIRGTARALNRAKKAVGEAAREMGACPKPGRRRSAPCK